MTSQKEIYRAYPFSDSSIYQASTDTSEIVEDLADSEISARLAVSNREVIRDKFRITVLNTVGTVSGILWFFDKENKTLATISIGSSLAAILYSQVVKGIEEERDIYYKERLRRDILALANERES